MFTTRDCLGKLLPGATNAIMTLQLDEQQGYYTLGEVTMDTIVNILSVTITSARRLSQVCKCVTMVTILKYVGY